MEINELPINAAPNSALNIELSDGQRATLASLPIQSAVTNALALKAPLASPALTGTPTAPTAATTTSTTQLATTAFVQQELAAGGSTARALVVSVRNQSGGTMAAGTVVYLNGATGNLPTIAKALATSDATSAQTIGMVQTSIANNGTGLVVVRGVLGNLNTSGLPEGQQLYLSPTTAGAYTTTKQYAPNHLVYIGVVTRAHPTLGSIEVAVQNGFELDELHDVSAQSPANGDTLRYNSATALWEKTPLVAAGISNTPAGNIAATTVQAAINELDSEKAGVDNTGEVLYTMGTTANQAAVFIGDSLTAEGTWVATLNSLPAIGGQYTGTNIAVIGETSTQQLARYNAQVKPILQNATYLKKKVFIWLGANDITDSYVNFISNITTLLSNITTDTVGAVDIYLGTIHKHSNDATLEQEVGRNTCNKFLRGLVKGTNKVRGIVDVETMFPDPNDSTYFADHVHFNTLGYTLIGKAFDALVFNKGNSIETIPPTLENLRTWAYPIAASKDQGIECYDAGSTFNGLYPFGYKDYSITIPFRLDENSTERTLLGGSANSLNITLKRGLNPNYYTGATSLYVGKTASVSTDTLAGAIGMVRNQIHLLTVERKAGLLYVKFDGQTITNGTIADQNNYTVASTSLGSANGAQPWRGWIGAPIVLNRQITLGEHIMVMRSGRITLADITAAKTRIGTLLNTSAFTDSSSATNTIFSSPDATFVRFANPAGTAYADGGNAITVTAGREYVVSFSQQLNSGTSPVVAFVETGLGGYSSAFYQSVAGENFISVLATSTGTAYLRFAGLGATNSVISEIKCYLRTQESPINLTAFVNSGSIATWASANGASLSFTNLVAGVCGDGGDTFSTVTGSTYRIYFDCTISSGSNLVVVLVRSDLSGYRSAFYSVINGKNWIDLVATETGSAKIRFASSAAVTAALTNINFYAPVSTLLMHADNRQSFGGSSWLSVLADKNNVTIVTNCNLGGAAPIAREVSGLATLVAGTVTVPAAGIKASTRVIYSPTETGTLAGTLRLASRVVGTSFTLTSSNGADTAVIAYQLRD